MLFDGPTVKFGWAEQLSIKMKWRIQGHPQPRSRSTRNFHEQMAPTLVAPNLAVMPPLPGPTHIGDCLMDREETVQD